jgi:N-acetylneuraminic acid mutarotase
MKAENEINHFCDDPTNHDFMICNMKEKSAQGFEVPYETTYLYDSVQVNNQIYFTGGGVAPGSGATEEFFKTAMRLTILEGMDTKVEKLPNMNIARANHTMAAIGTSAVFVIGGSNSSAEIASCEQYKEATKKWIEIASLNEKKMWVSVCAFEGKFLYAFGGSTKAKPPESDTIECLDTSIVAAKAWTIVKLTSGKELYKRAFFSGSIQINPETIFIFGGIANKAETDDGYFFLPKQNKLVSGVKLSKADAFCKTKPCIYAGELMVVGTSGCDLHIFGLAEKKWRLIRKAAWNPVQQDIKSATQ